MTLRAHNYEENSGVRREEVWGVGGRGGGRGRRGSVPVKERFHLRADAGPVVAEDDAQNDQGQHTRQVQHLFRCVSDTVHTTRAARCSQMRRTVDTIGATTRVSLCIIHLVQTDAHTVRYVFHNNSTQNVQRLLLLRTAHKWNKTCNTCFTVHYTPLEKPRATETTQVLRT